MENRYKKSFADLIAELEVKNKQFNIPDKYKGHLFDMLCDLDSALDDVNSHIELSKEYAAYLRDKDTNPMLLNVISGFETTFFYEALTLCGNEACEIITLYNTLRNLTERDETELIYCLIKSKYTEAEMPFPAVFDELRDNEDLFRDFMCEFLADLEEIITEETHISFLEDE